MATIKEDKLRCEDPKAGFSIFEIPEGETIDPSNLYDNVILFVMSGSVKVYFRKNELKTVSALYMFFVKDQDDYTFEITADAVIMVFSFEGAALRNIALFQSVYPSAEDPDLNAYGLHIIEPLYSFLHLVCHYLKESVCDYILFETKQTELFYILKTFYKKDETSSLFATFTDTTSDFKAQVIDNYMKVKTVNELASMLGYGITTFRVKFKDEFGISAYRWILNQKSKQIIHNMIVYGDGFTKIIDDFDFSSYSHFNKFCKAQYGFTPGELRKRLTMKP